MASTINTNIASLNAQRNLAASASSLAASMQRLSSGLRVNSAKDDAAGLAISERMRTQIGGLGVAARNANDGISLAQVAEGALSKVGDMLQRMRELAVQAANASNSDNDRQALQSEVTQLRSEIDRVAKQTSFNGTTLLDGSFSGAMFQVGANSGDHITLGALVDTRDNALSNIDYSSGTAVLDMADTPIPAIGNYAQPIPANTLSVTVGGVTVSLGAIGKATSSAERMGQVVEAINRATADTGVTAYLTTDPLTKAGTVSFLSDRLDAEDVPLDVTFSGFSYDTTGIQGGWSPTPPSYVQALTAASLAMPFSSAAFDAVLQKVVNNNPSLPYEGATSGPFAIYRDSAHPVDAQVLVAAIDSANNGGHYTDIFSAREAFLVADPTNDAVAQAYATALSTHFNVSLTTPTGQNGAAWTQEETRAAIDAFAVVEAEVGLPGGMNLRVENQKLNERGVQELSVSTQAQAWVALKKIDSAVNQVNNARAALGAVQARFENTVSNIDIMVENTSAARGRIVDADFARETANLARTQILQQAGTAMVAQANQIPQNVLKLLQQG